MRREAKRSVLASISVHATAAASRNGSLFDPVPSTGFAPREQEKDRYGHCSTTPFARTRFGKHCSGSERAGRAFTPEKHEGIGGRKQSAPIDTIGEMTAGVRLQKILGVHVPLSFSDPNDEHKECKEDISLDIARVHQLQRDLVEFSRNAYSFSQLYEFSEDFDIVNDETLDSQKQRLNNRLVRFEELSHLRQSATALLLHTSSLCPLCPLECASPAVTSSKSGLDIVQEMVRISLFGFFYSS